MARVGTRGTKLSFRNEVIIVLLELKLTKSLEVTNQNDDPECIVCKYG
jgi:hypothetical protein